CGHLGRYKKIVKKTYIISEEISYISPSLKDNLYNWIPPIRYVNLPNPSNILTKASAEKTLRVHFTKASEKRLQAYIS
ncbi:MAG: hypothetical protein ACLTS4_04790, partial [Blautia sp.]